MNSHLCGFTTTESARPQPSITPRMPGARAAAPAYAASTCSQICRSVSRTSAIAATGSTLVVDVVPTVATTAIGSAPAARSAAIASPRASGRIRNWSSTGIFRMASMPSPSVITALSTEECDCAEA